MIEAVFWDFGGVFTASPFHAVRPYSASLGIDHDVVLDDAKLARLLRNCQQLPGQHLFGGGMHVFRLQSGKDLGTLRRERFGGRHVLQMACSSTLRIVGRSRMIHCAALPHRPRQPWNPP